MEEYDSDNEITHCPDCRIYWSDEDHKCMDSIQERVTERKELLRFSDDLDLSEGQRNFYKILLRDMEEIIKGKIKRYPFERSLHCVLRCKKISYEKIQLGLRCNVIIKFINDVFYRRKMRDEVNFKEFIDKMIKRLFYSARYFGCFQDRFRFD